MCLHGVLSLSPVERVKKCRFSNTNKNQNCAKISLWQKYNSSGSWVLNIDVYVKTGP